MSEITQIHVEWNPGIFADRRSPSFILLVCVLIGSVCPRARLALICQNAKSRCKITQAHLFSL